MKEPIDPHATLSAAARSVLNERARRLARPEAAATGEQPAKNGQREPHLCFSLMDDEYALPLSRVSEVIFVRNVVLVPGAPEHLAGLTRLRGKVLALVDLRRFWHQAVAGYADCRLAVVMEDGGVECGLLCAQVGGLTEISPAEILPVPPHLPARLAASLRGLARRELKLLAPQRLLEQRGFLVDQTSARG
jgi:purine-binding chemotaxis protein CheW